MRHPTPKSARPDDAESRPEVRTDVVLAISEADRGLWPAGIGAV
jgi:hypothetical protein